MGSDFSWLLLLDAALRLATPLLFAALAGMLSERAGIIDIGLEGKMLVSAFAAAAWTSLYGSVWEGVLIRCWSAWLFHCCMDSLALRTRAIRLCLALPLICWPWHYLRY